MCSCAPTQNKKIVKVKYNDLGYTLPLAVSSKVITKCVSNPPKRSYSPRDSSVANFTRHLSCKVFPHMLVKTVCAQENYLSW